MLTSGGWAGLRFRGPSTRGSDGGRDRVGPYGRVQAGVYAYLHDLVASLSVPETRGIQNGLFDVHLGVPKLVRRLSPRHTPMDRCPRTPLRNACCLNRNAAMSA
ncbi:hypothetical protein GCM10009603_02600 [Nocardiopsis exhalans]